MSIQEYYNAYRENYNPEAWLTIRERRYEQIRNNNFYLEGANTFINEVLKFWGGNAHHGAGWMYGNSQIQKKDDEEWIDFMNDTGVIQNADYILKNIDNLELHGNYSWSVMNLGVAHGNIIDNMDALIQGIDYLFNENINIENRFNEILQIIGMGRNKASALLHIRYPDEYGVWNGPTASTLQFLNTQNEPHQNGYDEEFSEMFDELGVVINGKNYNIVNNLLTHLKENYEFENLSDVDIFVWYIANNYANQHA